MQLLIRMILRFVLLINLREAAECKDINLKMSVLDGIMR